MGLKTISPAALHELMGQETVTVLDVNAPGSWARAHVPGARALNAQEFREADLPADKDGRSSSTARTPVPEGAERGEARDRDGLPAGAVMSAGIQGWLAAGLPTQSGEAA